MKRILLFAAMLLTLSFSSKAQHQLKNGTFCAVEVTQECYNASCILLTSTVYVVPATSIIAVPPCGGGTFTIWKVCFVPNPCAPTANCTTVNGNNPMMCNPATYTGTIVSCDYCVNSDQGGIVTYNPLSGALSITP